MSRIERLLELMLRINNARRFTVGEMAREFGVSRRTMLRDLQALSAMGLPLAATPGPHGGYALIQAQPRVPLSFTVDEAVGLVLSFEAFLQHAASPFADVSAVAVTKVRGALSVEAQQTVDRLRRHVAIVEPTRVYAAPTLPDILQAALDGVHLQVGYASKSGVSERLIYPYGVFAAQGFWYCGCFDDTRQAHVALRADRITALRRREDISPRDPLSLQDWLALPDHAANRALTLRATVSPRGMHVLDWSVFAGQLTVSDQGGGVIDAPIAASEIDYYARLFLRLGTDATVVSPMSLIQAIRQHAAGLLRHYDEP